jgi:hypothetical protein
MGGCPDQRIRDHRVNRRSILLEMDKALIDFHGGLA